MFKAYFELLDPLQLVDSLRTSMIHPCLSLVTIGCPQQSLIQWVIIGNLKFEEYFGILYLLWVVHCLKTLKFHHCLSLVTTGYPQQPLIQWVIIGNLKLEEYFEVLYSLQVDDSLRNFKCASMLVLGYHCLPLATIDLVGDNREIEVLG